MKFIEVLKPKRTTTKMGNSKAWCGTNKSLAMLGTEQRIEDTLCHYLYNS